MIMEHGFKVGDFVVPHGKYAKEFFKRYNAYEARIDRIRQNHYSLSGFVADVSAEFYSALMKRNVRQSFTVSLMPKSPYRVVKQKEIEWE
jgi:hypothetical protein